MKILTDIITNKYIYIPVLLWLCIQIFKVIYDLIKAKKFNFRRIVGAGGMPSSHAASVCCLTTLIGKYQGFNNYQFAFVLMFSLIVMYDACGVRRAAGKQANILNKIISTPNLTGVEVQEKLVELLGHTPIEVFVGALLGIIVGIIF
ncbi:MAG: divergent PAP2 family protein [Clostridia bacterium]|nr:divergent PAP2 family protein [Clostridia bacterium]